jgi:hypothetical protein
MLVLYIHTAILGRLFDCIVTEPTKKGPFDVFGSVIRDHPHIWGTDEPKRKSPDGVLASEAISS